MTDIVLFFVIIALIYALFNAYKRIDKLKQRNLEDSLLISSTIRALLLKRILDIEDIKNAEESMKRDRSNFDEIDFEDLLYLKINDIETKILEEKIKNN